MPVDDLLGVVGTAGMRERIDMLAEVLDRGRGLESAGITAADLRRRGDPRDSGGRGGLRLVMAGIEERMAEDAAET